MTEVSIFYRWFFSITASSISFTSVYLAIATQGARGLAQVIPDRTLPYNSSVTSVGNTNIVDGGTQAGGNLFHSFEQFSILTNSQVYFNNTQDIQNIISRVTGKSVSNIDGLIRANGKANLFLINPNGIIFGTNATLDIGGSFVATTASNLKFADGTSFSTIPSQPSSLLTVSVPLGLQLGTSQTGDISNDGNLAVKPGNNLTLIANNVTNNSQLSANGGLVTLAALKTEGIAFWSTTGKLSRIENQVSTNNNNSVGTTLVSGEIDVSDTRIGQTGGEVFLFGDRVGLLANSWINASGDGGGGQVLVGGDYQGKGNFGHAIATYIDPLATIKADALTRGNGGKIVVWSNQSTKAYGSFSARGGSQSGNGGLIETSSQNFLDVAPIKVDAGATSGLGGTWLLGLPNITLAYTPLSNSTKSGSDANIFTASGDDAVVNIPDIVNQLNAGTNVTISTGSTGKQFGNITANGSGIGINNATAVTLTLQAANDILLQDFDINMLNAPLNLVFQVDSHANGGGNISINNSEIQTSGGNFTANSSGNLNINIDNASINTTGGTFTANSNGNLSMALNLASINTEGGAIAATSKGNLSISVGSAIPSIVTNKGALRLDSGNNLTITGNLNAERNFDIYEIDTRGGAFTARARGDFLLDKNIQIGSINQSSSPAEAISINARSISLKNDSGILSNTNNTTTTGIGASIDINADSLLIGFETGGAAVLTFTDENSKAGDVTVNVNSFGLKNGAIGSQSRNGFGSAGNVSITAKNSVNLSEGQIASVSLNQGNSGNIKITAKSISILPGGVINGESGGGSTNQSKAGDITLIADSIFFNGNSSNAGTLTSRSTTNGNTGKITIKATELAIKNGVINNETIGINTQSNAGSIDIETDSTLIENGAISSSTNSLGTSGDINLRTNSLILKNNGVITNMTTGLGRVGKIIVNPKLDGFKNSVWIKNEQSDVTSGLYSSTVGAGDAGEIIINADSIVLNNRGSIYTNSETNLGGDAGKIKLNANSLVLENSREDDIIKRGNNEIRSGINSNTRKNGDAGEIIIKVDGTITLNQSTITTNTSGSGSKGEIDIKAGSVNILNGSKISSETSGEGSAGKINLAAGRILVSGGGQVSASTSARGQGGTLTVNAPISLTLTGENSKLNTQSTGTGYAGSLDIKTGELQVLHGAEIAVNAPNAKAGDLVVRANSARLDNEGKLTAITGAGEGGNIKFLNIDSLQMDGGSLISAEASSGNAGNIDISARRLVAKNGAKVTVDGTSNGLGGDLNLNADFIRLDNGAIFSANTTRGEQGNIKINSGILALSRGSNIATNAEGGNVTGGNINLNTDFIFAVTDSDISANSQDFRGGRVSIYAQRIFRTPDSDITATGAGSQLSGTVDINTPDLDPNRGLTELPSNLVDTSNQIDTSCRPGNRQTASSFVVVGQGGLPSSPQDLSALSGVQVDWVAVKTSIRDNNPSVAIKLKTTIPENIVEATSWLTNEKGEVVLTTNSPTTKPHTSWQKQVSCSAS